MQVAYRRNLNRSYMVIQEEELYPGYEQKMLAQNVISGLLPIEVAVSNGKTQYWYEITGKQSLDSYLESSKMKEELLRQLIWQIYETCMQAQTYLLDEDDLWLDAEGIFVSNGMERFYFCYLPGRKKAIGVQFRQFAEYLLQKLDHTEEGAVRLGYEVYQLATEDGFGLSQMVECMRDVGESETKSQEEYDFEETEKLYKIESTDSREEPKIQKQKERAGLFGKLFSTGRKKKNDEKKSVIHGYDATEERFMDSEETESEKKSKIPTETLAELDGKPRGELRYAGTAKENSFVIEEDVFLIGSSEGAVNGVLLSGRVSRIHAKIVKEDGEFYLEDMNSTNGTFLNEEEVNYKTPVLLRARDHIRFADEEYIFS